MQRNLLEKIRWYYEKDGWMENLHFSLLKRSLNRSTAYSLGKKRILSILHSLIFRNYDNSTPFMRNSLSGYLFHPLTAERAFRALIDFTLSNARRFYSSMGNPLAGKGLMANSHLLSVPSSDRKFIGSTPARSSCLFFFFPRFPGAP